MHPVYRWTHLPRTITKEEPIGCLDGIDVADGLKRVAGNRALYRKLLLSFRQSQACAGEESAKRSLQGTTKLPSESPTR